MLDQSDQWARFAVITSVKENNTKQFVFSARRLNNKTSSYICQLQQQGLSIIQPHSTECATFYENIMSAKFAFSSWKRAKNFTIVYI